MASNGHGFVPPLLTDADPAPVTIINPDGSSPFLFIGDHAGNVIPSSLCDLRLPEAQRTRHIAWDIGVAALGGRLAQAMDATFVRQSYSRLVVDCNRKPDAVDAIPAVSDGVPILANQSLTLVERNSRYTEIHEPYQQAVAATLAARDARGQQSILISLHSFTPALRDGPPRPWQIGVLYDGGDATFATALLTSFRRDPALTVGDNEPYRMDLIDYTVPRHAYPTRRLYAELEIRQDLLSTQEQQAWWTSRLQAELLATASA
ncbi:MAG: N-formylglutamate amidohydrolase [Oxalobacteraceae bacterium]|nr:MAG: N-formylglutamate amidohydrolase [Oxalobacteraceae bacterium]